MAYPYNCIGRIDIVSNGLLYQGTGFLIGPNLVLTVAHNIFIGEKKEQGRLTFKLYKNQSDFEEYEVEEWRFNPRYLKQLNEKDKNVYDYALLRLSNPVLSRTKFLPIATNFGKEK
jgi:V8-like Glu-specific endopeptidase